MKILFLFLLISIEIFGRRLIFVQNLFRHGARYPIFAKKQDFTNQPKITKYLGQLTTQGKNMHYILGKILYKKYWKELFAGTSAQFQVDNRLIYVKSTNVNRTIESAQSQLAGWLENLKPLALRWQNLQYSLPPFENLSDQFAFKNQQKIWNVFNDTSKYQTIPIHTTSGSNGVSTVNPYDQGDFLLKFDRINCPKQNQWIRQNKQSQIFQEVYNLPLVKQVVQKLSQAFPSQYVYFGNVYEYVDNYESMKFLGEPTLKIFQDTKFQKAFRYIKEITMSLSLFLQPIQYYTTGMNLFENIVKNFKKVIDGTGLKLILYSAHDTTIGLVLATMNLTNAYCINDRYLKNISNQQTCVSDYPPFASNFIIEVYRQSNGIHTFEIVFNNIKRRIPFCNWQFSCSVQNFYLWFDSWKVEDPNKQCGIVDEFKTKFQQMKKKSQISYSIVVVACIIIIFETFCIIKTNLKAKNTDQKAKRSQKNKQIESKKQLM